MTVSSLVEEADLHALVDGELDPDYRRRVEDHLLTHPGDAALVENWRRQNAALRAAYELVSKETLPLSLRSATTLCQAAQQGQGPIETGATHWGRPSGSTRSVRRLDEVRCGRRRQAFFSAALALAVGAAFVIIALIAGTGPASSPSPATIVASAAQGFVNRAQAAYATFAVDPRAVEITAEHKGELLAWLRGRTGFGLAPDLAPLGLRLLGGRIVPGVAQPAGLLVYETADGQRVALYFEHAEPGTPLLQPPRSVPSLTTIEWRAAGMAFVLIGPLQAEALQAAAERAATQAALAPPANGGD